jgi:hypothetical protein
VWALKTIIMSILNKSLHLIIFYACLSFLLCDGLRPYVSKYLAGPACVLHHLRLNVSNYLVGPACVLHHLFSPRERQGLFVRSNSGFALSRHQPPVLFLNFQSTPPLPHTSYYLHRKIPCSWPRRKLTSRFLPLSVVFLFKRSVVF